MKLNDTRIKSLFKLLKNEDEALKASKVDEK
jgi:hypothetical protein